jgi:SEC-C motif-containing protein
LKSIESQSKIHHLITLSINRKKTNMKQCPCGKSKSFEKCCGRFLSGAQNAKTPEQLMRSRFTAYALGGYGAYLMATWFPASAQGLTVAELSEKTLDWKRLKVISSSQQGDNGTVEFKAWFCPAPNSGENPEETEMMHEISDFVRIQSRWYYVGGQVS